MSRNNRSNDDGLGCALIMLAAVVAMPLVGIYLAASGKDTEQKVLGIALLIVGIIVWIKLGLAC